MRFQYRFIGVEDKQLHEQVLEAPDRPAADQQFTENYGSLVLWEFPVTVRPYVPYTMLGRLQNLHAEGFVLVAVLPVDPNALHARVIYDSNSRRHEEILSVASPSEWTEAHRLFDYINMGVEKNGATPDDLEPIT